MSETTTTEGWQTRADELHGKGGVPPVRARVVALRETGLTYREIAGRLDQSGKEEVSWHIQRYREERGEADWLAEHGPDI